MASFSTWWNPGVWYLDQFAYSNMAQSAGSHAYSYGRRSSVVGNEGKQEIKKKMPLAETISKTSSKQESRR
ncbi:Uncharacterised protein [uncultured archaeon]|nr:Uncharacterised protein [uncultured archaeon]